MITGEDVYRVTSAIVPLYVAVGLGYASVRWWRLFDKDQCAAINRYVATLAVPFLSFQLLAETNLYKINGLLIAADSVSKAGVLAVLVVWARLLASRRRPPGWAFDWAITTFQVSALPNTLIVGIPVLGSMYGRPAEALMAQLVVAQMVIWFTLVLVLFELREAKEESLRVVSLRVPARQLLPVLLSNRNADEGNTAHVADGKDNRETTSDPQQQPSQPQLTLRMESMGRRGMDDAQIADEIEATVMMENVSKETGTPGESAAAGCHDSVRHPPVQVQAPLSDETAGASSNPEEKQPMALGGSLNTSERAAMRRMTGCILARKLARNLTLWGGLLGVVFSMLSYWLGFGYPQILKNSVRIVAQTGLGMAMFSLGLFTANQNRWIPCGLWTTAWTGILRFLVTPALMAALSAGFGLRGDTLRTAIVQAALPQGITPFVFASEYNVHPEVISTGVVLGTLASLPILLLFYVLLGL